MTQGTLKASGAEIRVMVHISKDAEGSLRGTFDSPDQGAKGITVWPIELRGTRLDFAVNALHASYEGTLNDAGTSVSGTWTQHLDFPLNFNVSGRRRKQSTSPPRFRSLTAPGVERWIQVRGNCIWCLISSIPKTV